ncbi:flagellar hook assembly protein FlgD [Terasakiella pusilla]|uniref:flagellar hook assembly protein FlgD n=1 Tax=Terasakiella pusilla TaxID=64973 RepID=UPI003AA83F30
MADAVTGIGGSSAAGATRADNDRQKLADDLDDFMTLLTTQLQHQDPLDPMDANEFTTQLVQFASVEQQIQQNANLEYLLNAQENSQLASVASYVGRMVEAETNQVQVYNGEAEFNYILHEDAVSTLINIVDDNGRTVFSAEGNIGQGKHGVIWDGTDLSGQRLPDGIYKLTVSALDADGAPVDVTTTAVGKVTGVSYAGTEPELMLTNQAIKLDKVISIQETAIELSEVDKIAAATLKAKASADDAKKSAEAAEDYATALQELVGENDISGLDDELKIATDMLEAANKASTAADEAYETAKNATSSYVAAEAAQTAAAESSKALVAATKGAQALARAKQLVAEANPDAA